MQLELEARDDAEVPAAAAQRPEQIRVLGLARAHDLRIRRHHLHADEVVAGETAAAHQPSESAAEREAGDTGAGDQAAGRRETKAGGRAIEVCPRGTAACPRNAPGRID